MTDTASLNYPYAAAPEYGTTQAIAPGVRWLAMPLAMALEAINLYLLEDHDGWYIVDTGLPTATIRQYWQQLLAEALGDKPVKGVIVTHLHLDHLGNAHWLTERFRVPLLMSQGEYLEAAAIIYHLRSEAGWQEFEYYRSAGVPRPEVEKISRQMHGVGALEIPAAYQRLQAGDKLNINGRQWHILVGRGHSSEHICLHCPALNLLLSGDHILPRISPNISVWSTEPAANPLADYLKTLLPFKNLPAQTLVLPAHNLPFRGLSERVDQLIQHHHSHLDRLCDHCQSPKAAVELMPLMFTAELTGLNYVMALGECIAHLNYLLDVNRLRRQKGADGLYRYSVVQ